MAVINRVAFSVTSLKTNQYIDLLRGGLEKIQVEVVRLTVKDVLLRRVQIVHVHWPEHYLRRLSKLPNIKLLLKFLLILQLAKFWRIPIVWTVHNIWPHEAQVSQKMLVWFFRRWSKSVDGCVYMAASTQHLNEIAHREVIGKPSVVIPHGHYRDCIPKGLDKLECRKALGLKQEHKIIGHFGLIKQYKNTELLAQLFSGIPGDNLRLIIAGKCGDSEIAQSIEKLTLKDGRIIFMNQHLADAKMAELVVASDVVVLPYLQVTNSGVALFALSAGRPIVGPNVGAFSDIAAQFGDWVRLYDCDFNTDVLKSIIDRIGSGLEQGAPDLSALEWDSLAAQLLAFYSKLAD